MHGGITEWPAGSAQTAPPPCSRRTLNGATSESAAPTPRRGRARRLAHRRVGHAHPERGRRAAAPCRSQREPRAPHGRGPEWKHELGRHGPIVAPPAASARERAPRPVSAPDQTPIAAWAVCSRRRVGDADAAARSGPDGTRAQDRRGRRGGHGAHSANCRRGRSGARSLSWRSTMKSTRRRARLRLPPAPRRRPAHGRATPARKPPPNRSLARRRRQTRGQKRGGRVKENQKTLKNRCFLTRVAAWPTPIRNGTLPAPELQTKAVRRP